MGEHTAPDFADPGCVAAGYLWRFTSAGEGKVGQMSHLGTIAAYDLTHCTVPGPDGVRSVGMITFTVANSDELIVEHAMHAQVIGDFPSGPVDGFTFVGTWEAVGAPAAALPYARGVVASRACQPGTLDRWRCRGGVVVPRG